MRKLWLSVVKAAPPLSRAVESDRTSQWQNLDVDSTLARLNSTLDTGLSHAEVARRLSTYGRNTIEEKTTSPVVLFAKKFWSPSAWMLEAILILSVVLGKKADAWVTLGLLLLNAVISLSQELRAHSAVEALKQRLQVMTRTLRRGKWDMLVASELVPGDIVRLRMGDFVPADVKIVSGDVAVDQSSLTGESDIAAKSRGDIAFAGSLVKKGECTGVVVLTGPKTLYGKTVQLVQLARPKLHMEAVVGKVVRWLFTIVGGLVALITILAPIRGYSLLEVLPLSLVILMSAVPVALPVMFTVTTALAAQMLGKKGVLVSRLSAAEDAATMDVLCVDKTGTITQNRLTVALTCPEPGFTEDDVLLAAALASNEADQDMLDLAILRAEESRGPSLGKYKQDHFMPFSPELRRTEAQVTGPEGTFRVMKGAVHTLLELVHLSPERQKAVESLLGATSAKGYRVLGVARTRSVYDETIILVGLLCLYDAPRPDSRSLIEQLRGLGVKVKMLTGDARPVASEIARQVGLGNIITAAEARNSEQEKNQFNSAVLQNVDGLAEVFPEDKFSVIEALQREGHVVGMTGDGVNDAPALQAAEVGIAVSTATDAAKSAASVVLTTEGLAGIIDLVENGRAVYQRILTWIVNKVSRTILKSGFVVLIFLITGRFVISALAMVILVFMTDFVKVSLATDHVTPSSQPDNWRIGRQIVLGVVIGLLMLCEALAIFWAGMRIFGIPPASPLLTSLSFQVLLFLAIFSILSIRERRFFLKSRPGRALSIALLADAALGVVFGLKGFINMPSLALGTLVFTIGACMFAALVLNESAKLLLLKATR